jgi:predicted DNA-binding transcriptional regulator YafY
MSDTLDRHWQILRMLPRLPKMISTPEIHRALVNAGFSITVRNVQKDMELLKLKWLGLEGDTSGRANLWAWSRDVLPMDTPRMSPSEALTFLMTEEHLRGVMPASTLAQMQRYFDLAKQRLGLAAPRAGEVTQAERQTVAETDWRAKVRVLPSTQPLLSPAISVECMEAQAIVQEALLKDMQCDVVYLKRDATKPDEYRIHPLGLVQRGQLVYLVCTIKTYSDIKLLALYRLQSAKLTAHKVNRPADFNLDAYIATGALGWGSASGGVGETIVLKASFVAATAVHLRETPLSSDQIITGEASGFALLTASVQLTQQLVWWLLGFGDTVEVLEPKTLRSQMRETVQRMAANYGE